MNETDGVALPAVFLLYLSEWQTTSSFLLLVYKHRMYIPRVMVQEVEE